MDLKVDDGRFIAKKVTYDLSTKMANTSEFSVTMTMGSPRRE